SYNVTGNLLQGTRGLNGGDRVSSGLFVNPAAGDFRLGSGAAGFGSRDLVWARMGSAPLTVPGIPAPGGGSGGSGGGGS
ncbi:hypothetical protein ABTJ80_21380, partial [Acinetobacter baumannii]